MFLPQVSLLPVKIYGFAIGSYTYIITAYYIPSFGGGIKNRARVSTAAGKGIHTHPGTVPVIDQDRRCKGLL
jgi:hypothetical protein